MKKQLLALGIMLLLLAVVLSGCTSTTNEDKGNDVNTGLNEPDTNGDTSPNGDTGPNEPGTDSTDGNLLVGVWEGTHIIEQDTIFLSYTFLADYTFSMYSSLGGSTLSSGSGTWQIINDGLSLTVEGKTSVMGYSLSNDGNTLLLTDPKGTSYTLQRQSNEPETNEPGTNNEKILGQWTGYDQTLSDPSSAPATVNFYANGSYFISEFGHSIWSTYTMTDNMLTIQGAYSSKTVECIFSENDNKMVWNEDGTIVFEFTRQ